MKFEWYNQVRQSLTLLNNNDRRASFCISLFSYPCQVGSQCYIVTNKQRITSYKSQGCMSNLAVASQQQLSFAVISFGIFSLQGTVSQLYIKDVQLGKTIRHIIDYRNCICNYIYII